MMEEGVKTRDLITIAEKENIKLHPNIEKFAQRKRDVDNKHSLFLIFT